MPFRKVQDTPRTPHPSHPAVGRTRSHRNTAGVLSANRAELRDTSKRSRSQHLHLCFRDVGAVGSSPVTSTSKPRRYGVSAFDEMPYLLFVTSRTLHRTLFPVTLSITPNAAGRPPTRPPFLCPCVMPLHQNFCACPASAYW